MVTDHDRQRLFQMFVAQLGEEHAGALMEMLPPMPWTDLATKQDLVVLRQDVEVLKADVAELKADVAEFKRDVVELRHDLIATRLELRAEIVDLRADMVDRVSRLDTRVNTLFPKLIAANFGAVVGVAGLVLAASHLT